MSLFLEAGQGESQTERLKMQVLRVPHSGPRAKSSRSPSLTGPLSNVLLLLAFLLRHDGGLKRPTREAQEAGRAGGQMGSSPCSTAPGWGAGASP